MSNHQGQLLVCPQCQSFGRRQVLGNLLDDGTLLVLRHSNGTTVIQATTLTLKCGCGYPFYITNGAIEAYVAS